MTDSNGIGVDYDVAGRIRSVAFSATQVVNYTYDARGNLASVTDWLGGETQFTYDANNQRLTHTRPNTFVTTSVYDIDGNLGAFTDGPNADGTLADTTLTYDANARIIEATRRLPTLASADGLASSIHTYDDDAQVGTDGQTFDALGRLTSDGTDTYAWDLASRLTAVGNTTFTSDGTGLRVGKTTPMTTRSYVWNVAFARPCVAIERRDGTTTRYYIHTPAGEMLYSVEPASGENSMACVLSQQSQRQTPLGSPLERTPLGVHRLMGESMK